MVNEEEVKEIQTVEETPTVEAAEEDDDSLPFPRARIVNLMRAQMVNSKQIRSEVKDAINIWMGDLLKQLSNEMSNTQFGSVGMADFQRATKPYDMIKDIVKDEERLRVSVDKLRHDSDHIARELDRFFHTLKGTKPEN